MNDYSQHKRDLFGVCETHVAGTLDDLEINQCANCGYDIHCHPVDLVHDLCETSSIKGITKIAERNGLVVAPVALTDDAYIAMRDVFGMHGLFGSRKLVDRCYKLVVRMVQGS